MMKVKKTTKVKKRRKKMTNKMLLMIKVNTKCKAEAWRIEMSTTWMPIMVMRKMMKSMVSRATTIHIPEVARTLKKDLSK